MCLCVFIYFMSCILYCDVSGRLVLSLLNKLIDSARNTCSSMCTGSNFSFQSTVPALPPGQVTSLHWHLSLPCPTPPGCLPIRFSRYSFMRSLYSRVSNYCHRSFIHSFDHSRLRRVPSSAPVLRRFDKPWTRFGNCLGKYLVLDAEVVTSMQTECYHVTAI